MKRSKIIVLSLVGSMITLTLNLGLFDTITPRESLVKGEQSIQEMEWNQTYGGTNHDYASALVQTVDGGFALAGHTYSFGVDLSDMWLVKTDANGIVQWNQTYGGTEYDSASALVQTTDGGFALAGYTDSFGVGFSDMWLVKTETTTTQDIPINLIFGSFLLIGIATLFVITLLYQQRRS